VHLLLWSLLGLRNERVWLYIRGSVQAQQQQQQQRQQA
jgi:hypothetical protein